MKAAQQTTESGNVESKKREGDANNNEENLRKWKTNLEAACQSSSGSGGHLDGWTKLSSCIGGQFKIDVDSIAVPLFTNISSEAEAGALSRCPLPA